ncbi:MAG: hypothetical protein Q8Q37_01455 [bacterium]|nr:hypothetical protein [bacterium]
MFPFRNKKTLDVVSKSNVVNGKTSKTATIAKQQEVGEKPRRHTGFWLVVVVIVLISVIILWWSPRTWRNNYQAVFLTDGQVYFGKLSFNAKSGFMLLKDVYYVNEAEVGSQLVLNKLGLREPHGPLDTMWINKNQINYVEDLRDDSQIIQSIYQLKNN